MANFSFGFEKDLVVESSIIPYAQFFNPVRSNNWGLGIQKTEAEKAGFVPDNTFSVVEHEFANKVKTQVFLAHSPKLIVLNKYKDLFMQHKNSKKIELFNSLKYNKNDYKAWGYVAIVFLAEDNSFLSELPFRLKITGHAGLSFLSFWDGYSQNLSNSLYHYLFNEYKQATNSVKEPLPFKAHMIYYPELAEEEKGEKTNTSPCTVTKGFKKLSLKEGLISRNQKIIDLIDLTKDWGSKKTILQDSQENNKESSEAEVVSDLNLLNPQSTDSSNASNFERIPF